MAVNLASIFGAEKDRVSCPFYSKTRACRHGDQCSRLHTKPRAAVVVSRCQRIYQTAVQNHQEAD